MVNKDKKVKKNNTDKYVREEKTIMKKITIKF